MTLLTLPNRMPRVKYIQRLKDLSEQDILTLDEEELEEMALAVPKLIHVIGILRSMLDSQMTETLVSKIIEDAINDAS